MIRHSHKWDGYAIARRRRFRSGCPITSRCRRCQIYLIQIVAVWVPGRELRKIANPPSNTSLASKAANRRVYLVTTTGARGYEVCLARCWKTRESSYKGGKRPKSASTTAVYAYYMGHTPGLLRGATANTPSARAECSRGKGGWRHHKCSNCNWLRDQPKVVCQCRVPLPSSPQPPRNQP